MPVTFARLEVPLYALLIIVLGYALSRAIRTWRLRASFFLTLLAAAVIGRSLVGVVASVLPTVVSIVFFEIEESKDRRKKHEEIRADKFSTFPVQKWDGATPLVVFDTREYFFEDDAVYEYVAGKKATDEIKLCFCRPVFLQQVEVEDLTMGSGGADYLLPENVQEALDRLNEELEQCEPIGWEQADIAVDVADLRERAEQHRSQPVIASKTDDEEDSDS